MAPDHSTLLNTGALSVACLAVFATFAIAAMAMASLGHVHGRTLPNLSAHSVVPIVIGYIVAHYLSFFVSSGLATLEQLEDPLGRGWALTSPPESTSTRSMTTPAPPRRQGAGCRRRACAWRHRSARPLRSATPPRSRRCGAATDGGADDGLHAHRPLVAVLLLNAAALRHMVASPASPATVGSA